MLSSVLLSLIVSIDKVYSYWNRRMSELVYNLKILFYNSFIVLGGLFFFATKEYFTWLSCVLLHLFVYQSLHCFLCVDIMVSIYNCLRVIWPHKMVTDRNWNSQGTSWTGYLAGSIYRTHWRKVHIYSLIETCKWSNIYCLYSDSGH